LETFWILELDLSRAVEREKEVQACWIVSAMMNTHPLKIKLTPKQELIGTNHCAARFSSTMAMNSSDGKTLQIATAAAV
jgi:hypothetical protein